MSQFTRWILAALSSAALTLTGVGCGERAAGEGKFDADLAPGRGAERSDAVAVAAVPLTRGRIESVLRYSANLEAESQVEVTSQASGRVTALRAEEGDRVTKGAVLLRLQDAEQLSSLARVESQLAKAAREFERQSRLYEQQLISEKAFSEATYELQQLEIARGDAERELSYTVVGAPISGIVTQRRMNLGDHVKENDSLFQIVDFDTLVARIYVPERELLRLDRGQPARITARAAGEAVHPGALERVAPTVDPRSGTVKVTISVPQSVGLRPGMYVEVELVAEVDEAALLLPKRALIYDQDQVFVFRVVGEDRVERRRVEPMLESRDFVKVAGELALGDRVVVAGQAGLKDGVRVRLLDLDEALATFTAEAEGFSP